MKQRIVLYDNAKGIGIILLILGHLFTHNSIPFSIIFSFHMPLFFFISGTFLKPYGGGKKLILNYLLPYIFFEFILGLFTIIPYCLLKHVSYVDSYIAVFAEVYRKIGSSTAMMESLWFLGVLSISLMIARCVIWYEKKLNIDKRFLSGIVFALLSVLSICMTHLNSEVLPLRIGAVPGATLLVYLGHNYGARIAELSKKSSQLNIVIAIILLIVLAVMNKTVNISTPIYNNYLVYLLNAIIGIYIVYSFSNRIKSKPLEFIGRNSLILFAVHGIWLRAYSIILTIVLGEKVMFMENIPHWLCIPGCVFVLLMSVLTYYCINGIYTRYFNYCKSVLNF